MKLNILLLGFLLSAQYTLKAQGLTQSADGKSTIPLRGAAIGIDIAKTDLTFGYNNINTAVQSKTFRWIYGAEIKVKNEEGIANLFSSGNIVPAGNLNVYTGVTVSNVFNDAEKQLKIKRDALAKAFTDYQTNFRKDQKKVISDYITDVCNQISNAAQKANALHELITTKLTPLNNTEEYYDQISALDPADDVVKFVYEQVKDFARKKKQEFTDQKKSYIQNLKDLHKQFSALNYQRLTVFGFGGISAINFKKYKGVDSSGLSKSFEDVDDRGGNIGLGINYQFRNIWLGVTYSYVSSNNFSSLTKTDYNLKTATVIDGQELTSENKVTAYSGKYGEVELNNLNADVVFRLKLDKEYKNYLLLNPYVRASIYSRDTSLLSNKTNFGSGFYFLQNDGKFLGGFYVELPDLNNNAEKRKPSADQHILPPLKKLSFGIVAKFNLSSIMGW